MEDFTTFFFILICASVFYVYLENKASDVTYITHNNIEYLVRNLPDKEEAALLLPNPPPLGAPDVQPDIFIFFNFFF